MNDILLRMTADENRVYARACLTYSGVPFHRVKKARTGADDLGVLDRVFDRLIEERRQLRSADGDRSPVVDASIPAMIEISFSEAEFDLLTEALEAVLQEHMPPNPHSDYDLELHVGPREEVEPALEKLRSVRQEQTR